MHSRVSEPLLAHTGLFPAGWPDVVTLTVEEEHISPGSQPQGQETAPESSVSLSTGMV